MIITPRLSTRSFHLNDQQVVVGISARACMCVCVCVYAREGRYFYEDTRLVYPPRDDGVSLCYSP